MIKTDATDARVFASVVLFNVKGGLSMKRLMLLFGVLVLLEACTKYEKFPLRPMSFEIDGRTFYSAKDTQTMTENIFGGAVQVPDTLRITEYGDSLFSLSYRRKTDFLNYDMSEISLGLGALEGRFESGKKYEFSAADSLNTYPYVYLRPVRTSSESEYDLYSAMDGWIEIYEVNHSEGYVSGLFEFDAVLTDKDECSHKDKISVKNGSFRNIPFVIVPPSESDR